MRWLVAIVLIYVASWLHQPPTPEWFAVESMLLVALALHAGYSECRSFRSRSVFAIVCLAAWADLAEYLTWLAFDLPQDFFAVSLMLYLPWLTWIWMREYDIRSDRVNHDHICLLFLRPRGFFGVIKSFFGVAVSSVCIVTGGKVYSFRRSKGCFTASPYTKLWLRDHVLVDTGAKASFAAMQELEALKGTSRFPRCKCVWSIRHVLNMVGGKYMIQSIFDYVPGVYAVRVLGRRK